MNFKTFTEAKSVAVYHAAPTWARKSIRQHGVDPTKCEVPRSTSEKGFFCFDNLEMARWYAKYMANQDPYEPFDIWKITTTGKLIPDWGLSSADEQPQGSYYHEAPITKARLVQTIQP